MQNSNTLNLPQNVDSLKEAIKLAIESFQGSPVKNLNKLNESTAIALGFKNYDQLSSLINNDSLKVKPINVERFYHPNSKITVDSVSINEVIFDEEIVEYKIIERDEEILCLYEHLSGSSRTEHDKNLIKIDLNFLQHLDDEYVLSNVLTNEYISPSENTERFNEICQEFLEAHSDLERKEYSLDEVIEHYCGDSTITNDEGHWECSRCTAEWSACMGDNEVPFFCPHCSNDVEIINVLDLDDNEQENYSNNWAIMFDNGNTVSFDTEYLACDYQKRYRELVDLNIDSGENLN
jgi:hypothetical protein